MAGKPIIKKGSMIVINKEIGYLSSEYTQGKAYKVEQVDPDGTLVFINDAGVPQNVERADVEKYGAKKESKVPTKKIEKHEIIGQDYNKRLLEVAIKKDLPVLLIGETGTGKTSLIREQAIVQKADWTRFNLTGETTVDEFVGKYELEGGKTVWRDGILLTAMKKGQWLIVDEINVALPEILFVLHSLLDDDKFITVASHSGEIIQPHTNFRFFATMNPTDEYAGTKELNKAFASRFNVILKVHYPSNEIEAKIVSDKTGVDISVANRMADVASALRMAKEEDKIFYTCSTRDLLQWGNLIEEIGMEDAFIVSVLNKANGDADTIVEIYDRVVGKYIALEKQGYKLSIDWFEKAANKLEQERQRFEDDQENIRKEITEEIVRKLTSSSPSKKKREPIELEADILPF